ncbi:hypothetical protein [Kineococcus sp. G2]|uniref:hypothetical protein n=1 Tax=Kineococcus sp. G2 TaxID=3127484 RepID=UPI00301DC3AF
MRTHRRLLGVALLAVAFGALDSFANASGGLDRSAAVQSVARFTSYLLNAGWAWAALAAAAAAAVLLVRRWWRRRARRGALLVEADS